MKLEKPAQAGIPTFVVCLAPRVFNYVLNVWFSQIPPYIGILFYLSF